MESNENEIKELRQHLSQILRDKIQHFWELESSNQRYIVQIKSWCITLFMVSTGFCLSQKEKLDDFIFIGLPLIPVVVFWFYNSYKEYDQERRTKKGKYQEAEKILNDLYNFSYDDLKNLTTNPILSWGVKWADKGKTNWKRFFKKKLPGTLKKFRGLENLLFFSSMFLFWVLISIKEKFYF